MGSDNISDSMEQIFEEVYTKFKMHFYREVFMNWETREASLTTVETFCMEVIYAMRRPTIREFASFIRISQPNATYKINSLIAKGYLTKTRSEHDRREYYLDVTQKYLDYYNVSTSYVHTVMERMKEKLPVEKQEVLAQILDIMSRELMADTPDYTGGRERIGNNGSKDAM